LACRCHDRLLTIRGGFTKRERERGRERERERERKREREREREREKERERIVMMRNLTKIFLFEEIFVNFF